MKQLFKILLTIAQIVGTLLVTIIVSIALLQLASQQPKLGLQFRSFVVQSGSMEPTIMTGDVIFIRESRSYGKDDVVTYRSPEGGHIVTHRIVGAKKSADEQIQFQTKGDNNQADDPYTIAGSAILGRRWFTIPKLGYVEVYGRSKMGQIIIASVIIGWIASDYTWQQLSKKQIKKQTERS